VGRHFYIERNDRICLFCFLNENRLLLEDEFHECFICPKCAMIRRGYLYSWYSRNCEYKLFTIYFS